MNENVSIYYEKSYIDDIGKKYPDLFSKNIPEFISYRKMWSNVIDGFMICENSDLTFVCTEGNIRIVVVTNEEKKSFSQYFLGEMDGKIINIKKGTNFAIQNIDEHKSSYLMGYTNEELSFTYSSKNMFDWKRKIG